MSLATGGKSLLDSSTYFTTSEAEFVSGTSGSLNTQDRLFDQLDRNHDGAISRGELARAMQTGVIREGIVEGSLSIPGSLSVPFPLSTAGSLRAPLSAPLSPTLVPTTGIPLSPTLVQRFPSSPTAASRELTLERRPASPMERRLSLSLGGSSAQTSVASLSQQVGSMPVFKQFPVAVPETKTTTVLASPPSPRPSALSGRTSLLTTLPAPATTQVQETLVLRDPSLTTASVVSAPATTEVRWKGLASESIQPLREVVQTTPVIARQQAAREHIIVQEPVSCPVIEKVVEKPVAALAMQEVHVLLQQVSSQLLTQVRSEVQATVVAQVRSEMVKEIQRVTDMVNSVSMSCEERCVRLEAEFSRQLRAESEARNELAQSIDAYRMAHLQTTSQLRAELDGSLEKMGRPPVQGTEIASLAAKTAQIERAIVDIRTSFSGKFDSERTLNGANESVLIKDIQELSRQVGAERTARTELSQALDSYRVAYLQTCTELRAELDGLLEKFARLDARVFEVNVGGGRGLREKVDIDVDLKGVTGVASSAGGSRTTCSPGATTRLGGTSITSKSLTGGMSGLRTDGLSRTEFRTEGGGIRTPMAP